MLSYTGSECIVCKNKFLEEDDVVVCPDCGTPYHRECWKEKGRCINTSLHAIGGSWQAQQSEVRLMMGGKTCPQCQYVNRPGAQHCDQCGCLLTEEAAQEQTAEEPVRIPLPGGQSMYFDAADPCCGLNPEEPVEEEKLGDVAKFVRTNTLYYIPLFRRFRDTGRKISVNLTCILFPHFYFAYRKMWPMAILSALVMIVCQLPYTLLGMLSTLTSKDYMELLTSTYGAETVAMFDGLKAFLQTNEGFFQSLNVPLYLVSLAVRVLLCMFGNYLYFRFVMKSVGKIRKSAPTDSIRSALIQSEGGTSFWNVLGCIGIYYAAVVAVYVILAVMFM